MPAESCILARLLPAFSLDGRSAMGHLNIVQLVRLSKRAEDSAGDYHNLRAVYNLIPNYYQAGAASETWYYYHDHTSGGRDEAVSYTHLATNVVTLITREKDTELPKMSKADVAGRILDAVFGMERKEPEDF